MKEEGRRGGDHQVVVERSGSIADNGPTPDTATAPKPSCRLPAPETTRAYCLHRKREFLSPAPKGGLECGDTMVGIQLDTETTCRFLHSSALIHRGLISFPPVCGFWLSTSKMKFSKPETEARVERWTADLGPLAASCPACSARRDASMLP